MTTRDTSSAWPPGGGEMARLIHEHDWTATRLGPPASWSERLKGAVEAMLVSPLVSSVAVGPDRLLLYNDAAARLFDDRHPAALGRPLALSWPDAYPVVAPLYDRAFAGEAVHMPAQPLNVSRAGGKVFEAYLTPVRGEEGTVLAVHMTGFEVGARLRAEAALRESEATYRTLFEEMDEGFAVEDEFAQREVLVYNLEAEGFDVIQADNGEDALQLVEEDHPDIIILDWMMPKLSGIEVCRRLKMRPETRAIPIIMLSARAEEVDRVRGLETGADDYVIKPYSMVELMARARVQIRRVRPSTVGMLLQFEDIRLDAESHRVYRGDKVLRLGPTEFRLLTAFMEKPGRVWSRDQLLDRVWGRDIYVDTRTVDVHVGRLRKTLCAHGQEDPIRTVRGSGYALG